MSLVIDTEKLEHGLEEGVLRGDVSFRGWMERKEVLRMVSCGLVTSAIGAYLRQNDIPHQLLLSDPQLSIDPGMRHTFPLVGKQGEGEVVDASYSQFFQYVGMSVMHEKRMGIPLFPQKKVLHFPLRQREEAVDWVALWAVGFRDIKQHTEIDWDDPVIGPLENASRTAIFATISEIWNPEYFEPFSPSERVVQDGEIVARHIPKDAIIYT